MLSKFTLFVMLCLGVTLSLQAQENRFIDPIYDVSGPTLDTFGRNIDPFNATLAAQGAPLDPNRFLKMDVYQPEDNDTTLRPVVVLWHTGNFLPRFWNVGIFGTRQDSAIVEFANRLAGVGYVSMSAEYRAGWDPTSTSQDVRTGTLLQAAYRGGQDAHMMARYLRKTVVEEGNPYRIDTSRIVFWGFGTGGYVAMTHAFLDRIEEVEADERFFSENDQPFVSLAVNSNPQGTTPANLPNTPTAVTNVPMHLGYESTVAMSVNAGGALGDLDWMEGKDEEPITIGFHYVNDANAPYSIGEVIVPTTRELVVGDVAGTEQIVENANMFGLNDDIESANDVELPSIFSDLSEELNEKNEGYQMMTVDGDPTGTTGRPDYELSHNNMYPLGIGLPLGTSGAYNFTSEAVLRASIQAFNATPGVRMLPEDAVVQAQQAANPNLFNPAAARQVIDTMMAYFIPRAYIGLNLGNSVSTQDIVAPGQIDFQVFPNPAKEQLSVRTAVGHPIREVFIADINGRILANYKGVDQTSFTVPRNNLKRGTYLVYLQLDAGISVRKVIFE